MSDRHQRVKDLFLRFVAVPREQRHELLREACTGDPSLLAEVESLLDYHEETAEPTNPVGRSTTELNEGDLFADRYRIVALLGRGGMGTVYRAHDTLLDVTVAVKLIEIGDPAPIINEVRLAREITHHAIVRVFDAGQSDGRWFFTMEYVDGEDLASLVRRIGRLSSDKVVEIGAQICAGLAVAHARGVLHRDLKPANIMIDSRGHVRITDFGIAVKASDASALRWIAGTPAYMAPEQLRPGAPLSIRTDLYSLGLILWELVTGRPAIVADSPRALLDPATRSPLQPPSLVTSGIDPRLDAAILQATDCDPARRPASALAMAVMLPGANVLRMAIDAGETPPPEVVAASAPRGGLRFATAMALLLVSLIGLAVIATLNPRIRSQDRTPFADAPLVIASRARDIAATISGDATPPRYEKWAIEKTPSGSRPRLLYRSASAPMVPSLNILDGEFFVMSANNPPLTERGMRRIVVDADGRLLSYAAVPSARDRAVAIAWPRIFETAGLDASSARPLPPRSVPPVFGDGRLAWSVRVARDGPEQTHERRVEAAMHHGRIVWLDVIPADVGPHPSDASQAAEGAVVLFIAFSILTSTGWLARRNLRLGRGDRSGARRIAIAIGSLSFAATVIAFDFTVLEADVVKLLVAASLSLMAAAIVWLLYLALEPFVRRRWPHALVSWTRLLAGDWKNPSVARDVLVGATTAIAGTAMYYLIGLVRPAALDELPVALDLRSLAGARFTLAELVSQAGVAVLSALSLSLLFSLAIRLLRRADFAAAALILLFIVPSLVSGLPIDAVLVSIAVMIVILVLFVRFGLVALMAAQFFQQALTTLPLNFASPWQAELSLVTGAALVLIVMSAFRYVRIGGSDPRPAA